MEPDVIRMYSSSPPPMEDAGAEEEDDEFGDFGGFSSGVPASVSFTEFDTPATFNQGHAPAATSPPELLNHSGVVGLAGSRAPADQLSRQNGVVLEGGPAPPAPPPPPAPSSDRTVSSTEELKKIADHDRHSRPGLHSLNSLDSTASGQTEVKLVDCNGSGGGGGGGVAEVLTNGFATFGSQGPPPPPSSSSSLQNSVHSKKKGPAVEYTDEPPPSPEDDFADFSAFSNVSDAQGHSNQVRNDGGAGESRDHPEGEGVSHRLSLSAEEEENCCQQQQPSSITTEQEVRAEDNARDTQHTTHSVISGSHITGSDGLTGSAGSDMAGSESISRLPAEASGGLSNGQAEGVCHRDSDSEPRDSLDTSDPPASARDQTGEPPVALNGVDLEGAGAEAGVGQNGVLPDTGEDRDGEVDEGEVEGEGEQADEKGSGNETETETETSFGRPLSTDALEEYGDLSTTGSVPSPPPLQEEVATPADHSQLPEDDDGDGDEDFGDFGDVGSFSGQGFADFDQPELPSEQRGGAPEPVSVPGQEVPNGEDADDEDFGDFDGNAGGGGNAAADDEHGGKFADFPASDSFADFASAPVGTDREADGGWNAFDEPAEGQGSGDSWAAFGDDQPGAAAAAAAPMEKREEEEEEKEEEWKESRSGTSSADQTSRADGQPASLSSRLEKLFQASFPAAPLVVGGVVGGEEEEEEEVVVLTLKTLLEPPERLRPAEEGEKGRGTTHNGGVRGDVWSQLQDIHDSFGLRHQWGGSHSNKTLLCSLGIDIRNILFTGQKKQPVIVPMYAASLGMLEPTKEPVKPVSAAEMITSIAQAPPVAPETSICPPDTAQEVLPPVQFDWSSSGLTNPLDGVDPELFELTTAKLDPSGSGSRVADAFARLMSTMEKTSTSTRKPRKEENLSEEAAKVISSLPDLSFMTAKVLMFPTTLTPLGCTSDPDP